LLKNNIAQRYILNENFYAIYDDIILFQNIDASKKIETEIKNNTDNLLIYYLKSKLLFMEAIIEETNNSYDNYHNSFNIIESALKKGNKNSPYYGYCIGNLYLQRGVIGIKSGEYIRASMDLRRGYKYYENNAKKYPNFIFQYNELGLLNSFIGSIPNNYTWLVELIGFKGSLNDGIKQIINVLQISLLRKEFEFLQLESLLYLSYVYKSLNFDNTELNSIIKYSKIISDKYKSSPLYIFIVSSIHEKLKNNSGALDVLNSYYKNKYQQNFYYLDYIMGNLLLHNLDTTALYYFNRYVNQFNGENYIKSSYLKIAWIYLLKDDNKKYNYYLNKVLSNGNNIVEADKQAMNSATLNIVTDKYLLKARLLFDGGYYDKAIKVLSEKDERYYCKSFSLCLEYKYRLARIYDLSNNFNQAIQYYKEVINIGRLEKSYFAANSALMLGHIYENQKKYDDAKKYYNMCLELPLEEYRNSIQQKAKAGLERIGY